MLTETKTHRILRLILFLSSSYRKTKDECCDFLEVKSSAFYTYCNLLKDIALQENRQFKICRIGDVVESPIPWVYERLHRSLPVDIFRNTGELDKLVEFQLNLRAKNLLIEEYPLAEKYLTVQPHHQFTLKAPVAKYEGPGRFVMGIAEDIQLVGDDGFVEYLKIKINNWQNTFCHSMNPGVEIKTFMASKLNG